MKERIYILAMITFILAGCYEDKGNYDYKNVNDLVSITFTPEPVITNLSYNYEYRQPSLDTLRVTYSPVITQSMAENENDLEYQWILSTKVKGKISYDTVRSKDLLLKYPPKKKSEYTPLFRVIDRSTGIEYYQQFEMKTKVPFIDSWFVLHGQVGDRELGVVEGINLAGDVPSIFYDVYKDMWGVRRFENATKLLYTIDGSDIWSKNIESLIVIQPDSCSYMHAYDLVVRKGFERMMPNVFPRPRLAYGLNSEAPGVNVSLMVDQSGHFYWSRGDGWYYTVKTNAETVQYIADKIFLSSSNYVVVWDKVHKQFMYYSVMENPGTSGENRPVIEDNQQTELKLFDKNVFAADEWAAQEVLYMGQGNRGANDEGSLVIAVDANRSHTVYHINFDEKGEGSFIQITKTLAPEMNLDEDSQIATSVAFQNQIFYTRKGVVYLYNMISREEIYLYDAGGPVTKLQFRIARQYSDGYGTIDANRRLAIVVNRPDGTGELHEIFLDVAGDVEKTFVHTGFGPIQDIVYSAPGVMR